MYRPIHFHPVAAIGAYILTLGFANYLALVYLESGFVDTEGVAMTVAVVFVALGAGAAVAPVFNSLRTSTLFALIAITSVVFNIAQLTARATLGTAISGDLRWTAILAVIALAFIACTSVAAKICSGQYRKMLPNGKIWTIPILVVAVTMTLKSVATASSSELFHTATIQSSVTTALCAATMFLASLSAFTATLIFQAVTYGPLQRLISFMSITLAIAAALAAGAIAAITGSKLLAIDYFDFFHSASVALEGAALEGVVSLLTVGITLAGFWFLERIKPATTE